MEQEQAGGEHAFDHLDGLLIVRFGQAMRGAGGARLVGSLCRRFAPGRWAQKSRKILDDQRPKFVRSKRRARSMAKASSARGSKRVRRSRSTGSCASTMAPGSRSKSFERS